MAVEVGVLVGPVVDVAVAVGVAVAVEVAVAVAVGVAVAVEVAVAVAVGVAEGVAVSDVSVKDREHVVSAAFGTLDGTLGATGVCLN